MHSDDEDPIFIVKGKSNQNINIVHNSYKESDSHYAVYQNIETIPQNIKDILFQRSFFPFLKAIDPIHSIYFGPLLFDPETPDFSGQFTINEFSAKLINPGRAYIICISKSNDPKIFWPAKFSFSINSKIFNIPTGSPTPETMNFWIDITNALNLNHTNTINIYSQRANALTSFYVFGIVLLSLTNAELIQSIEKHENQDNFNILYKKSNPDDEDVGEKFISLPLYCPLSQGRISIPIRGVNCEHLAAMDAESYFSFMRFAGTWTCPICGKSCKPEELYIDDCFHEIIKRCPMDMEALKLKYLGN
ncbi:MIZ zinc finger family protein [Trichomonas vaginalis G3]|uniref:MIZ zinc finger family protein n=1 Tax=Trichomonas vaginalis (strain ATCC PRA-98 / G3) TaxID=412133 RepID=A2G2P5_TRIV3|nr:SUMO transferase protein [Trichomonas vaginalis G3]EAX88568.1 MIZ zinc finger family protein [Trichomonas vaginalis G3]KAI5535327.1 SUMO transferase protein [Trichomonas vaginalis G3]|eukprot:XP_001301498.1 MIZ zinc finger family protein [Trichomonas vaginalis G3]